MLATRLPANTLQGMMDLCCQMLLDDGDATFYSQRVFDLFPQLATSNSGFAVHTANGSSVFGSEVRSGATNNSDYMEWTVYVPAGSYKLSHVFSTGVNRGIVSMSIDGGALSDSSSQYHATGTNNNIFTSGAFTLTEGAHTIRLQKNGKEASSASYILSCSHAQLIKQDAGSALNNVANVPHVINVPVVFADSHTNFNTLSMSTTYMFGTRLQSSGAQNAAVTFSFWAPKGAATLAVLCDTGNSYGIAAVSVDGSSWGTIDLYTGSNTLNVLDTSLTGTLATTGIHTITFTMSTKNASSSNYAGYLHHIQIRMTSITEPLAQDLAPEVALLWPVFNEAMTFVTGLVVTSAQAYYHYFGSSGGQNQEILMSSNITLRPGTYRIDVLGITGLNRGNMHVLVDGNGNDEGFIDQYSGSTVQNVVGSVSDIVLAGFSPHSVKLKMATKNASSGNYFGHVTLARLIRTGS